VHKVNEILAPISVGELYDKISILEIKLDHVGDNQSKRSNIQKELDKLIRIKHDLKLPDSLNKRAELEQVYQELKTINLALWKIEDMKRRHEKEQNFDQTFVALARQVYINNDRRAEVKRKINEMLHSDIVEEKIY
jgi:Family of unknown function (DUF6165)